MLSLRIAICDDEEIYLRDTKKHIERYTTSNDVNISIETFSNPLELLNKYNANEKYDVVFLDVEMPEINGLELAEKLKRINRNVYIIFLSNYPRYMQDSFKIHPFYYLVKPLSYSTLQNTMTDIILSINDSHSHVTLLSYKDVEKAVNINDIRYIEVENSKKEILNFHLYDESSLCNGTIKEWTEKLEHYDFFQCNRSTLVNLSKIHFFEPATAVLDNGEKLPISRLKEKPLKEIYSKNIVRLKNL